MNAFRLYNYVSDVLYTTHAEVSFGVSGTLMSIGPMRRRVYVCL